MAARYRLYPIEAQQPSLVRHCADARYVWNLALEQFNHYDRRISVRRAPGPVERQRQLAQARKDTWLGAGSSSVQQQALRDFDRAVKNWWRGSHRRPRFRKAGLNEGFCIRDVSVKHLSAKWATIQVPKCGYVRFRLSRPLPKGHGMARVTLDRAGRWHISFAAVQTPLERVPTGRSIGIDLGIVTSVASSDGDRHVAPTLRAGERRHRLALQRKVARQRKWSNRRAKTKLKIARLTAREADRLRDWREKVTTQLVIDNKIIAIEDLKVRNMMRSAKGTPSNPGANVRAKAGLNREIARQGWSAFALRLEQKAEVSGVEVIRVDPKNTSRRCNLCSHTDADNRKSQAVFVCQECGHQDHADVNAAKNILAAGLAVAGRGGIVRPIAASAALGGPGEASTTEAALCAA